MARFLPNPTQQQAALILLIFGEFRRIAEWPTFGWLDRRLLDLGSVDAREQLGDLPGGLIAPGFNAKNPHENDLVKLTVPCLIWVAGRIKGQDRLPLHELELAALLVREAARMQIQTSPAPPTLTFRDATRIASRTLGKKTIIRLGEILALEQWGFISAAGVGTPHWRFRIGRDARPFSDVSSLETFLIALNEVAASDLKRRESTLTATPDVLSVLYLSASPAMEDRLRVDIEARQVQQAVRGALHRDLINIHFRPAATFDVLLDGLNDVRPKVVHFSGHANSDGVFFDDPGFNEPGTELNFALLVRAIAATDSPPILVVFNACDSLKGAEALLGTVQAIVATAASVSDLAASLFATRFYAAIASGQSLKTAVMQGAVAVDGAGLGEGWKMTERLAPGMASDRLVLVGPGGR